METTSSTHVSQRRLLKRRILARVNVDTNDPIFGGKWRSAPEDYLGWIQALFVCQWVHEHTAERVSGVSAANRFTDFVAVLPLSLLVHTEYVDNFVGLSQEESVVPTTRPLDHHAGS